MGHRPARAPGPPASKSMIWKERFEYPYPIEIET
jgi:hypothetical protein